jgi:hypothetical protein
MIKQLYLEISTKKAIHMAKYAAATLDKGDHLHLPNTHSFEYSEIVERIELEGEKLEFRTRVLAGDDDTYPFRPEGTESVLVVGRDEPVEATLYHDVRNRDFDVEVVTTKKILIRVSAPDKVAAESGAYWRLSSDRETSDSRIISEDSDTQYKVSDELATEV